MIFKPQMNCVQSQFWIIIFTACSENADVPEMKYSLKEKLKSRIGSNWQARNPDQAPRRGPSKTIQHQEDAAV